MAHAPIDSNNHKGLIAADSTTGTAKVLTSTDIGGDAALHIYSPAGKLVTEAYDYIEVTEGSTTDVFVYKRGGTGGTTVGTVTVTYTDTNKNVLDNVART